MSRIKILLFLFLSSVTLFSQPNKETFNKSAFALLYTMPSEHNGLETYWQIENGIDGYFTTQFYIGDISVGVSYIPFKSFETKRPDFSSYYIYLGWAGVVSLPLNSTLSIGVKTGSYLMTFDSDTLNSFQQNESELAIGPYALFTLPIVKHFAINISSEFITVFTHRPIKLFNISAGVSYTFTTPNWLRKVFE